MIFYMCFVPQLAFQGITVPLAYFGMGIKTNIKSL